MPWMSLELANIFLSHSASHSWITTRIRMLRNKTPLKVGQWLNDVPIPALRRHSSLLRQESSLEYFHCPAQHEQWAAQVQLRVGESGWAFLYGPTVDKHPGDVGYQRHDPSRPPFSEPFFSACLQATLHGGPCSAFVEADGGGPNRKTVAVLARNAILRLAVILHQQFKGLSQDEGPKLMRKMQVRRDAAPCS